jgi:hypothetical protein
VEHSEIWETASRSELLEVVRRQQTRIRELEAQVGEQATVIAELIERLRTLETRGGPGSPTGMPGTKPTTRPEGRRHTVRKPREQAFSRPRGTPTRIETHAVEHCPDCGCRLLGGWVKWTREVVDLPPVTPSITEHRFLERECPLCRKRVTPTEALAGIAVGKGRLGIGLLSALVTLREEGRLPVRTIQRLAVVLWQISLSVGTIVNAAATVARAGTATVAAIAERVRGSPFLCADETGWREDGRNGYVWTLSTPTERYFVFGRRTRAMAEALLGETFAGVLVTDFYASYNFYDGPHQRCWAHLLREIHDLVVQHPTEVRVSRWARAVHRVFVRARAFSSAREAERQAMRRRCEDTLLRVGRSLAADPAPVGKLARRIERFLSELFTFVTHPDVPPDNNAAERSLRHLVTSRKISGGSRSSAGTTTKTQLATLFGTWRALGLNPFEECRKLLALASFNAYLPASMSPTSET